jgi:hypothetical protein
VSGGSLVSWVMPRPRRKIAVGVGHSISWLFCVLRDRPIVFSSRGLPFLNLAQWDFKTVSTIHTKLPWANPTVT